MWCRAELKRSRLIAASLAGILTGACGIPTPAAPPSAQEVLAKPQHSNLRDAHFTVTGRITENSVTVDLVGDGALVYKPKPQGRFRFQTTIGGESITIEEISLDGTNYGLSPGASKWAATKSENGIDPSAFAGASDQKYLGEVSLPQGKAWHASAKDKDGNAFDAYIRESDGYPIKYVETQTGGQNITLMFDKYNTGVTITPPPPDQIQPG
jgi:hypothetical protein